MYIGKTKMAQQNITYRLADKYYTGTASFVKEKTVCILCFLRGLKLRRMETDRKNEMLKHKLEAMRNTYPIMRIT